MPAQTTLENSTTHPQVKLPGGATLVAVTDRNADMLLKPKLLEKPHVTITMGDKQIQQPVCLLTNTIEQPMMTAIMQTPTAQIPLNIPYPMPIHNLNLVQPPPLPQLRPYGLEPAPQQQQQVTTQIINHHMTSSTRTRTPAAATGD